MRINPLLANQKIKNSSQTNVIKKNNAQNNADFSNFSDFSEMKPIFYMPKISFGNDINFVTPDEQFFNEKNPDLFSINFFNKINGFLIDYKKNTSIEDSFYLTDKNSTEKAKTKRNVTLIGNSFAKNIQSEIADLYEFSKSDNIDARLEAYLFDNSASKSISAKKIYLSDNSQCEKNTADVVWLKDNAFSDKINAQKVFQRNFSSSNNVSTKNFYAKDCAACKMLEANNVVLKDCAKVDNATANDGQVELYNNSTIENLNVRNSKIILNKNAKITNIFSENDLYITGDGKIGDIIMNGSHLYITGPLKINGKIRFSNPDGVVIVQKGTKNIFPQIDSSMVENGILQFLIQNKNDMYLGNPTDIFSNGLEQLNQNIDKIAENKILMLSKKAENIDMVKNNPEIRNFYNDFYKNYLNSLVFGKNNENFSRFWVENAKLGKEKVSNLWMKFLGEEDANLSSVQKTYRINNLSDKEREILSEKTADFWFKNVLPELKNKKHFSDYEDYKNSIKKVENCTDFLQDFSENKISTAELFEITSSLEFCDKSLLDFWLETEILENRQNINSNRLKKEQFARIITNKNSRKKIIKKTKEELQKQKNFIKTYEFSCSDLAKNEPQLDKLQLKLLEKYKNSKIFYQIIFESAKGVNDKIKVESQIIKTLQALAKEQNQLAIDARKDIFDKTLNVKNVVIAKPNSDLSNYTNFVFNALIKSVNSLHDEDFDDFSAQVYSFKNFVNKNSYFLGDYWENLVKTAYNFYKTKMIEEITDNNLNLLHSLTKKSKELNQNDKIIAELLNSNNIDTIEQKEFIARYKDDYNFKKLIDNTGVNQGNMVHEMLMIEAVNENLYQNRLDAFNKNFNPEYVKENLDLTDKYLVLLDKDFDEMTVMEKYQTLSRVPSEEFLFMNKIIMNNWRNNELKKFMSQKFMEIQLNYNINAQAKSITEQLFSLNNNINNIRIELSGQSYLLSEIVANLDNLVDISKKSFKELYFIGVNIEAINDNTQSIKANTRGILYSAMQNAKLRDPELSKTIEELLPATEKLSFTEFVKVVEKKHAALKNEKKKKQLKQILSFATIAIAASTAGTIDPSAITGLLGGGEIVNRTIPVLKSIADTLKHVAIFKAATTGLNK